MTVRPIAVLLAFQLGVIPAFAQHGGGFQRRPSREREAAPARERQGNQGARSRERETQSRAAEPSRPAERSRPSAAAEAAPQRERGDRDAERQRSNGPDWGRQGSIREGGQSDARDRVAVQRERGRDGARDRDSGPRVAVPRQGPPPRVVQRSTRPNIYRPNVYVGIGRTPSYRYTPRFNRPYVYGSLGAGYFYYGSYGWYPRATYYYDGGYFGRGYGYDTGEVRLQVQPRFAEVYVDGYYAGTVDDFDGTFQSLRLESGPYHIEIVAPGYDTLEVDLRVSAGQKITYRGDLRPEY